MRVNARKVLQAFNSGQCYKKVFSFWTDGVAIYSYGTTLFEFDTPGGDIANPVYYFNDTRYSAATTLYQNSICEEFLINRREHTSKVLNQPVTILTCVPQGTQDLVRYAKAKVA